jgi:hypothetical protein
MNFLYPIMGHFLHDSEIEYSSHNCSSINLSIKKKVTNILLNKAYI